MTQTSILSAVTQQPGLAPSEVFRSANLVLRENISRLNTNRYMTLNIIRLEQGRMVIAGKHQDVLVWRAGSRQVETVVNHGCWIGMVKDTAGVVDDLALDLASGDVVLLFTDGVTEASGADNELYGQDRLVAAFERVAQLPLEDALQHLLEDVKRFAPVQEDDITLLLIRKS
jgi:serine phosphatase RsbU (regulator of sigma subunit)